MNTRDCFCGCGNAASSSSQFAGNLLGLEMNRELAEWMKLIVFLDTAVPGRNRDNEERFLDDGRGLWVSLREQVHHDVPQRRTDRRTTQRWLKFSAKGREKLSRNLAGDGLSDPFDLPTSSAVEIRNWLFDGDLPDWASQFGLGGETQVDESAERPRTATIPESLQTDNCEETMNESGDEGLGRYLKNVRPAAGPTSDVARRIESLFDELGLPWRSDGGGGWEIQADIGQVLAGVDEDGEILTFWQPIHPLEDPPKKRADYLAALLRMNMSTTGACYALDEEAMQGDSRPWVTIIGRIAAQSIDKEEIEATLGSLFKMSAVYDQ